MVLVGRKNTYKSCTLKWTTGILLHAYDGKQHKMNIIYIGINTAQMLECSPAFLPCTATLGTIIQIKYEKQ